MAYKEYVKAFKNRSYVIDFNKEKVNVKKN